jgi:hypothetical protein
VDVKFGLALIELEQTRAPEEFKVRQISDILAASLKRLQEVSTDSRGSLQFRRSGWYFEGPRIYIVKPAILGQWTRTMALNDAADIYASIAQARRETRIA